MVLIVSSVLLVLFSLLAFFHWKRHKQDPEPYSRNSAVADSAKPEQTALELIRKMADDKLWLSVGEEKRFFTELTDVLRQYFYRRYDVNALEMTSSELIDALKKTDMPLKLRDDVRFICFTGDMTKFAKHKPQADECASCVTLAEGIVLATMPKDNTDKQDGMGSDSANK